MDRPLPAAPGARCQHPLYRFKGATVYDRRVGIFYNDPLGLWQPDRLFGFIANLFVPSLYQIADVGLIMEHLIDRRAAP